MLQKPECRPYTNTIASPKQILAYLKQGCEIKQVGQSPRFLNDAQSIPKYFLLAPNQQWEYEIDPRHVQALETLELITVDCCGGNYWVSKASLDIPKIENVHQLSCSCGWKGDSHELTRNSSLTHADSWWECPECGEESAKLTRTH